MTKKLGKSNCTSQNLFILNMIPGLQTTLCCPIRPLDSNVAERRMRLFFCLLLEIKGACCRVRAAA